MANESITFDFVSRGASSLGRDLRSTGDNAALAAKGARLLADSLAKERRAADASAGATLALAKSEKILADAEEVLSGRAIEAGLALKREKEAAQDAARENAEAAAKTGLLGGALGDLGGPLAAAGVGMAGLAPIAVTLGIGVAGFGAAAAAALAPLVKASASTDALAKAFGALDPAQRQAAVSLMGLRGDFRAFQKALEPTVLADFGAGVGLAGHLLQDVQPVAAATGEAFGQLLGRVDAELQSGTWQRFFSWMAGQAAPDMAKLTNVVVDLTNALPPLLRDLQPVGMGLLTVADDAVKAAHAVIGFYDAWQNHVPVSTKHTLAFLRDVDHAVVSFTNHIPGGRAVNNWITGFQHATIGAGNAAGGAVPALSLAAAREAAVGASAKLAAASISALTTAETKALTPLLDYSGALIAQRTDAATLADALKKSHDRIGLQTVAQRASFSAANAYIGDLAQTAAKAVAAHKSIDTQISSIERALPLLDKAKTKNRGYWLELRTLKGWLDRLRSERIAISVTASGQWSVAAGLQRQFPGRRAAAGWRVPGFGGGDRWPALLEGGESVVPKHLTPLVAPLLKSRGVPGFAAGVVGAYAGGLPALPGWLHTENAKTARAVEAATAAATLAGMRAAFTGMSGALGGDPAVSAALARRMMPAWGSGAGWSAWNYLNMRESGWNRFARNSASGAYGIPQALPESKLPFAGQAAGGSHAGPQIGWQIGYVLGRYGSIFSAAAHERAFNWYGGGLDAVFPKRTLIGVGERGAERVSVRPVAASGGRQTVVWRVEAGPGSASQFVAALIKEHVNVVGGGDVQVALGRH